MKFQRLKVIAAFMAASVIATISSEVFAADFQHDGFVYWVCNESGHRHDKSCSCGGTPIESHNSDGISTFMFDNATCTERGYDSATFCTVCGYKTSYHYTTPALGHDWDNGTITVQPTTTSDGVKTFMCSRCYKTKTEVIPKIESQPVEPSTPTHIPTLGKGDANCDGRVNTADATAILKHIVGITMLSDQGFKNADMDGNGYINSKDATAILKLIVNKL